MSENLRGLERYFASHQLPYDARRIAAAVASPDVRAVFAHLRGPNAPTAAAYGRALEVQRRAYQAAHARCFAEHRLDALVFPTTPLPAAGIGEDDLVTLCGQSVSTFDAFTRNANLASVIGVPGISLPMGVNESGLPLGIEIDAPAGMDRRLLSMALGIEAVCSPMPPPSF